MINMIRPAHSRFSASSGSRWLYCSGSVNLIDHNQALIESQKDEDWISEGRIAHDWAARFLKKEVEIFDKTCSLPLEARGAVRFFVDYVRSIKETKDFEMYVEEPVNLTMHDSELYGTPDVVLISEKEAHIVDYKHGAFKDVTSETQLMIYALLFLEAPEMIDKIYLHYVQPQLQVGNKEFTKTWRVTQKHLIEFKDQVKRVIKAAKHTVNFKVGSWCDQTFCPVRGICPAYSATAKEMFKIESDLPAPESWTPQQIHMILKNRKKVEKIINSVESYVKTKILADPSYAQLIKFEVKESKPQLSWNPDNKADLKEKLTRPEAFKQTVKTPKQLIEDEIYTEDELRKLDLLTTVTKKTFREIRD